MSKRVRYLSVCSGIEAATVAWHPLGWSPAAFSEIEAFPARSSPTITQRCRATATSPRSEPTSMAQLTFLSEEPPASPSALRALEAAWVTIAATWPSNILGWLTAHGPGGWFGRTSPASCHRTEDGTLVPFSGAWSNSGIASATECLTLSSSEFHSAAVACSLSDILETGDVPRRFYLSATACRGILRRAEKRGKKACAGKSGTPNGAEEADRLVITQFGDMAGALTARHDSSPCADRGMNVVAFSGQSLTCSKDVSPCLDTGAEHHNRGVHVAAFMENQRAELRISDQTDALACGGGKPGQGYAAALTGSSVRRLTPRECERLQGFPDDYTLVPYRGKPAADGPRYKALGNSMAVPCMVWLGQRIQMVDDIAKEMRDAA
jgi:hypothetical protein